MAEKRQTFLININILEGRHYAWANMDSYVLVRIMKQKRYTPIKRSTDCPYYNEYFVFEFTTTFEKFLDYNINITVLQPGKLGRKKRKFGYFSLDVATVWSQPDHQFFNKWAILASPPNEEIGGARGYLKVNIAILAKGEAPKIPVATKNTDDIETNLLLPEGASVQRQRAHFVFDVYRAEHLISKDDESTIRTSFDEQIEHSSTDSHIEISFAGSKVKTSVKRNTSNPVWDERLIITEPFPTLSQRIEIKLCLSKSDHSTRYIYLKSICSDREHGFLPTYGPSYLHFYKTNSVKGYVGSLLLELNTELLDIIATNTKVSTVRLPKRSSQQIKFPTETTYLFATIFNATTIKKSYKSKPISFKITQGHINAHPKADVISDSHYTNSTDPVSPRRTNKKYWHVVYQEEKPCLYLPSLTQTFKRRMYNVNMLEKISENLKQNLSHIEEIFDREDIQNHKQELEESLLSTIENIQTSGRKYLDLIAAYNENGNKLDNERIKLSKEEMNNIVESAKDLYDPKLKRKCFRKLQKIESRIRDLVDDVQDALPDVYIWMYSGKAKAAFCKVPVRSIIYSNIEEEKGTLCGKVFDTFLEGNGKITEQDFVPKDFACKVRLLLWLGLDRHIPACMEIAPPGFVFEGYSTKSPLPGKMNIEENHIFQCRAHIFQGRFIPGSDKTGLCDPFVQIVIGGQSKKTEVNFRIEISLHATPEYTAIRKGYWQFNESQNFQI